MNPPPPACVYEFGDFRLDAGKRLVTRRDGTAVALTPNISALRRVFDESPGSHHYIVTVPGRGYRFVAEVRTRKANAGSELQRIPATAIEPSEREKERLDPVSQPDQPATSGSFRPILLETAAVLALSVAALFLWRGRTQGPRDE